MDQALGMLFSGQTNKSSVFTWQISTPAHIKKTYQIQENHAESNLCLLSNKVVRETAQNLPKYHY